MEYIMLLLEPMGHVHSQLMQEEKYSDLIMMKLKKDLQQEAVQIWQKMLENKLQISVDKSPKTSNEI